MIDVVVDVVQRRGDQGGRAVRGQGDVDRETRSALTFDRLNRSRAQGRVEVLRVGVLVDRVREGQAGRKACTVERHFEHRDPRRAQVRHEDLTAVRRDRKAPRRTEVRDAVGVLVEVEDRLAGRDVVEVPVVGELDEFGERRRVEQANVARALAGQDEVLAVRAQHDPVGLDSDAGEGLIDGSRGHVNDGDRSADFRAGEGRDGAGFDGDVAALVGDQGLGAVGVESDAAGEHAGGYLSEDRARVHIDDGDRVVVPVERPDLTDVVRIGLNRLDLGLGG